MMNNKHKIIVTLAVLGIILLMIGRLTARRQQANSGKAAIVYPVVGKAILTVTSTGVVEPQNRLEIKPSIGGRVEKILVKEGDIVKTGDILAWMSSTERAALVDAARSQGDEVLRYWEEVYKKTPIISPIDGEVIVRSVEPGQTVTTQDAVLVLSDRLIINAQFDETDIGRIKVGQEASITLDAYPSVRLDGVVYHIAYESEIVNNVTIYDVDILPKDIPEILRSGMSVSVEVIEKTSDNALTLPSEAIHYDGTRKFVLVKDNRGKGVEKNVVIGLDNGSTAEIISGLTAEDGVIVKDSAYLARKKSIGKNPFMPFDRKKK